MKKTYVSAGKVGFRKIHGYYGWWLDWGSDHPSSFLYFKQRRFLGQSTEIIFPCELPLLVKFFQDLFQIYRWKLIVVAYSMQQQQL